MRQIIVNEPDINLRYVYFRVFFIDGVTPAEGKDGEQPEVNINNDGWTSEFIGPLETMGYGNYRALLTDDAINQVGNIILSHYLSPNTLNSYGEDIQVVASLAKIPIFEAEDQWDNNVNNIINLTYLSLPEAETYFSTRLNSEAWDDASQKDKTKSLIMATRDINRLNFFGVKLDSNQPLEFPRKHNIYRRQYSELTFGATVDDITADDPYNNVPSGDGINCRQSLNIPDDIKIACCEIAIKHLEGVDIEEEMKNLTIDTQRFSAVHESYSRTSTIEAYRAGINSTVAWTYLKAYLVDPLEMRLTRVS